MMCDEKKVVFEVCPSVMGAAGKAAEDAGMPVPLFLKLFLLGCMEEELKGDGGEAGTFDGKEEAR